MNYQTVELCFSEGVATLSLNRPDKLNSFNQCMHQEMRAALKEVKKHAGIRCLVITGKGRAFCAGQDLSDRDTQPDQHAPDLGRSIEKNYNPLIRAIKQLEIPVICAVNGVAAGAGANIALACDIVIAARSASFIQSFCKIGLVPDSGGTWALPRLVGHARAMGLSLLGDKLSAEKAEQWGLIWQCVADEELPASYQKLARHFACQPTYGLSLIKRALNASSGHSLDQQLDLERDFQQLAGRSADYKEGVKAFMEKRPATFTGIR